MLFSSSPLQSATYLLGVCLFSISFLVFLNASISFVITDRIGKDHGIGDDVGTLGFADELIALVACPIWGILSDRIGVRTVCVLGYGIVGLALFLFVQATNVYPQLLMARLFFSIGGAATTTMVTAILPAVTAARSGPQSDPSNRNHATSPSVTSELTITPERLSNSESPGSSIAAESPPQQQASAPRLAGLVGMFTGLGALLALGLFLPLATRFSEAGASRSEALADSYYLVGAVALLVALFCFWGLRNLQGEEGKSWRAILDSEGAVGKKKVQSYARLLLESSMLSYKDLNVGLAYTGGAVARASSVGISLFIPLYVNHYYISSGICKGDPRESPNETKELCKKAYVLAAQLTGTSQLAALLAAPIFGYLSDHFRRFNLPLITGALFGVLSYIAFGLLKSPEPSGKDGNPAVFVIVIFIGFSQISAIVCSLGILGQSIQANSQSHTAALPASSADPISNDFQPEEEPVSEVAPLLSKPGSGEDGSRSHLKGSIAGIYSLAGGAGILLLTKLGGYMFDTLSPAAPFYLLAAFNAGLLATGLLCSLASELERRRMSREQEL